MCWYATVSARFSSEMSTSCSPSIRSATSTVETLNPSIELEAAIASAVRNFRSPSVHLVGVSRMACRSSWRMTSISASTRTSSAEISGVGYSMTQ